jgi:multidrug efflux pump subunit AcrA (membrane-fusion protein)
MKRSLKISLVAGVSALLLLALGARFIFRGDGTSGLTLGSVVKQDLVQRVTIAGTIVSRRRTLVPGPYAGYIKQLFVKVGDKVKTGQPLVSVVQSLQSSEPVFPLRAPYEGTVMHVQKHEGEYVKEGDTSDYILRLDDIGQLYVQATAPEVDRVKLKQGMQAIVKASPVTGRTYKGVITELTLAPQGEGGPVGSSNNRGEYPTRIEITDQDDQIGPGMSAVIDIITNKKPNVLTLRHEFVLRAEDGTYYAYLANGEKRKIEVGSQNEEAFEIKSGLQEGEKVRQVDFSALAETTSP